MSLAPFGPCYLAITDLAAFGLPTPDSQPTIMNTVQMASMMIDEACGRLDGDGNGSLVFSTYTQQLYMSPNNNLVMLPQRPLVGISSNTITELTALASATGNNFYTGVLPSTVMMADGNLSAILSCSGRYGYGRQDLGGGFGDAAFLTPATLLTAYGGPAPWIPIDIVDATYEPKTGELWLPAGLLYARYSEIKVTYNSGFDPRTPPIGIKFVCASTVKNLLAKGDGTTGMRSFTLSKSGANATFDSAVIDATLDAMLGPYKTVRAY